MRLALYKGPAASLSLQAGHLLTRVATLSAYSHCELEIGGVCHSSSIRDGGVRAKVIADLATSGHWDLFPVVGDEDAARQWFDAHKGQGYDWTGVAGLFLRWVPKQPGTWFCSESIAEALGLPETELSPQGLLGALARAGRIA